LNYPHLPLLIRGLSFLPFSPKAEMEPPNIQPPTLPNKSPVSRTRALMACAGGNDWKVTCPTSLFGGVGFLPFPTSPTFLTGRGSANKPGNGPAAPPGGRLVAGAHPASRTTPAIHPPPVFRNYTMAIELIGPPPPTILAGA
jgi:hypothetical protein